MRSTDSAAVLAIYDEGIASGHATFQTKPPSWDDFDASFRCDARLVAEIEDRIVAWAALSDVSDRCAYSGVCELTIYVARTERGRGVGAQLLAELVDRSEILGIWTLQAGIFPENKASIALHRSAGFRVVGTRERLGKMRYGPMAGQWRDVVLLERRSRSVHPE